jgi:mono/diheme cytochrome c family protein
LRTRWLIAAVLGTMTALAPAASLDRDLHAYWDSRCRSCHGDAGAFARRTLRVERGRLLGAHHADAAALQRFLQQHYIAEDLIAPVTAMLTAQATTPPLFAQHCAGCHGTAAAFARSSLTWRNGLLVGSKSGRTVEATLRTHGGLTPADAAKMLQTLQRVMGEVGAK